MQTCSLKTKYKNKPNGECVPDCCGHIFLTSVYCSWMQTSMAPNKNMHENYFGKKANRKMHERQYVKKGDA